MASPAVTPNTCVISVNLFDGWRQPLQPASDILFTVNDGNQKNVLRKEFRDSTVNVTGLQFFNNFGDNYTVIASGKGYEQAGFTPVKVSPQTPAVLDIMLLKKSAGYDFSRARWQDLRQNYKAIADLAAAGAADEESAAARYGDLVDKEKTLACFFNLTTAMSQLQLPDGTPLDYIKEVIWDNTMAQDRFFAWADPKLVDQVVQAAHHGAFSPEPGTAAFHKGATRSFKQVQFGEANVQLTFHENDHPASGHTDWIMVEPDIDYYKDPLAHSILEVLTNKLTHSVTDPRQVYLLRWIAGRRANVPNFEPPYGIA